MLPGCKEYLHDCMENKSVVSINFLFSYTYDFKRAARNVHSA